MLKAGFWLRRYGPSDGTEKGGSALTVIPKSVKREWLARLVVLGASRIEKMRFACGSNRRTCVWFPVRTGSGYRSSGRCGGDLRLDCSSVRSSVVSSRLCLFVPWQDDRCFLVLCDALLCFGFPSQPICRWKQLAIGLGLSIDAFGIEYPMT